MCNFSLSRKYVNIPANRLVDPSLLFSPEKNDINSTKQLPLISSKTSDSYSSNYRTLSIRDSGRDVKDIQNKLKSLGYNISPVELNSSFFGLSTTKAIIEFKKSNNLVYKDGSIDEKVGSTTLAKLTAKINEKANFSNNISFDNSTTKTNKDLESFLSNKMKEMGLQNEGVVIIDINTGDIASVNGTKNFYPASVIKVPVMAEAFNQISQGKLDLNKIVTVKYDNVAPTWMPDNDKRPLLNQGSKVTVKQLLDLMITRSDNTATNVLIDLLGRKNITNYMSQKGLGSIELNRKLSVDSDPNATGRNKMTSLDTAKLMAMIAKGELAGSSQMMGFLGNQMANENIPQGLPKGAKVYHKTGETSKTSHDVAIIKNGNKTYIMSVFTNMSPGQAQNKIIGLTSKISKYPTLNPNS